RKSRYVNRHVVIMAETCPYCGSRELTRRSSRNLVRLAYDLHFTRSGICRRVTRFTTLKHRCLKCEGRFLPHDYLRLETYYHSLKCWAMNEHVAHRSSFGHIADKLNVYFGVPVRTPNVYMFKGQLAQYYARTCERLLDRIVKGDIIHADETSVHIK